MANKDKLTPEEIRLPPPGILKSVFGGFLEVAARKRIDEAVREHAMLPDGRMDSELADYIEKKMLQSKAIGIREVLGPGSWIITLAAAARALAVKASRYDPVKETVENLGKNSGFTGFVANHNLVISIGAAVILDSWRMRSKFSGAMTGELEGALESMKAERYAERIRQHTGQDGTANEMPETLPEKNMPASNLDWADFERHTASSPPMHELSAKDRERLKAGENEVYVAPEPHMPEARSGGIGAEDNEIGGAVKRLAAQRAAAEHIVGSGR